MADNIKMMFSNDFTGDMSSPTAGLKIGRQEGGFMPYHLLFGALGSCFYATFLSIVEKKRLSFSRAEIEISGTHRAGKVATLEKVLIDFKIYGASDEAQFTRSAELGAEYCSIHKTISQVADIRLKITFL